MQCERGCAQRASQRTKRRCDQWGHELFQNFGFPGALCGKGARTTEKCSTAGQAVVRPISLCKGLGDRHATGVENQQTPKRKSDTRYTARSLRMLRKNSFGGGFANEIHSRFGLDLSDSSLCPAVWRIAHLCDGLCCVERESKLFRCFFRWFLVFHLVQVSSLPQRAALINCSGMHQRVDSGCARRRTSIVHTGLVVYTSYARQQASASDTTMFWCTFG